MPQSLIFQIRENATIWSLILCFSYKGLEVLEYKHQFKGKRKIRIWFCFISSEISILWLITFWIVFPVLH